VAGSAGLTPPAEGDGNGHLAASARTHGNGDDAGPAIEHAGREDVLVGAFSGGVTTAAVGSPTHGPPAPTTTPNGGGRHAAAIDTGGTTNGGIGGTRAGGRAAAYTGDTDGTGSATGDGNGSAPSGEPGLRNRSIGTWVRWIITFNVVCAAWIFFWQGIPGNDGSLNNAVETFKRLAHWGSGVPFNPVLIGVIAGALLLQFTPPKLSGRLRAAFSRMSLGKQAIALALVLLITTILFHKVSPSGIAPFIYFKF
jgi:hypothetical protein